MPFDPALAPNPPLRRRCPAGTQRVPVAVWLFGLAAMIFVMVILGGATRLTGSGLSIMEWAPLAGALPPLSHADWARLFALYKTIPQYDLLHPGMGLAGFQGLFWLEWVHRLWGRLLGVALLLPLAWFWWRGAIDRRLGWRLVGIFVLGGLQGAVGWFMVASGFEADSTAVSANRLVAHLVLALALYAALLWTALSVLHPARRPAPARRLRAALGLLCGCVAITIVAGGFTAGLHAGLVFNTFPLMDGQVVPPGYGSLSPFARNLFENVAAVQFDHRLLATVTALLALATVLLGWRATRPGEALRTGLLCLGAAVLLQYALGVATLLYVVPIPSRRRTPGECGAAADRLALLPAFRRAHPAHSFAPGDTVSNTLSQDTALSVTDRVFFQRSDADLDADAALAATRSALAAADDGELFLEWRESEAVSLDDGRIRAANYDTQLGFGLRAVAGEATGYAHSGEISKAALARAAATVSAVAAGHSGTASESPRATNARLYSPDSPFADNKFGTRTGVLAEIDAYARGRMRG